MARALLVLLSMWTVMELVSSCPTGWHYYIGYCYYTSPTPTDRAHQLRARTKCKAMDADLTSITDHAEMNFVKSISTFIYGDDYWLGLNKTSADDTAWYDGNPSTYRNWVAGQPDEGSAACIYYSTNGWADRPCNTELYYTCKKLSLTHPGAAIKTFYRCRAGIPTGQYFTINECSVGQVILILSAEAGFSERYIVQGWPLQCPWSNCTRPIDQPARKCNGLRHCHISQMILMYPQGSVRALCSMQRDGNFIKVKFMCITDRR